MKLSKATFFTSFILICNIAMADVEGDHGPGTTNATCIDNICIGDLVADESSNSGMLQVFDIEGDRLRIGKKGDRFTVLRPVEGVHGDIVELNSCEEYSRFYECTYGENNEKRILGMKYSYDREIVEPYLQQ